MRAGIYLFFDEKGIVDGYVGYFLKELKKVVDYLVVVVNGAVSDEGRQLFSTVADDFFARENKGFDVWAYHDALDYIGWDELKEYDELVITNSTIFGPLYPFEEVFRGMEDTPCDWWGLQRRYEDREMTTFLGKKLIHGYMPEFSLSNFWVIRKRLLHSDDFKIYWENIPEINSYAETCIYHEPVFTKTMCDAGYTFATVDGEEQRGLCPSPTITGAYQQVAELGVPIVRRRLFTNPYDNFTLTGKGEQPGAVMNYITHHTDYDETLIWDYLLRTQHQYDLKNNLTLTSILPSNYMIDAPTAGLRVAVILHIYYLDLFPYCAGYLRSFPASTPIYLVTNSEERLEQLKELAAASLTEYRVDFLLAENRGRDVSALLIAAKDVVRSDEYDLICFLHDKKVVQRSWSQVGRTFSDTCYRNLVCTPDYVQNVIRLFEKEPKLGIASPPPPNFGVYHGVMGGSWGHPQNIKFAREVLNDLGLSIPLDVNKPAVAPYGTMFWFRREALKPLFDKDWQYEDFPAEPTGVNDGTIMHAIERCYALVAQGSGFYPKVILNTEYAELELTFLTYECKENAAVIKRLPGIPPVISSVELRAKAMQRIHAIVKASGKNTPVASNRPTPTVQRSKWKKIARNCTPIGIWNLMRRIKCLVRHHVYVNDEATGGGMFKKAVKWCMPRGLWNMLRKRKCRALGWDYVEE